MPCFRCNRRQTDPSKGKSPWARFVKSGAQLLICPVCQEEVPDWQKAADVCPNCGSTHLVVMLGSVVCKKCHSDFDRSEFETDH